MTEFIYNEVPGGESPRLDTLLELAGNMPYIFVSVMNFRENDDGFDLKIDVGGGVRDLNTIWYFLERTKRVIEIQMLERGEVPTIEGDDDAHS